MSEHELFGARLASMAFSPEEKAILYAFLLPKEGMSGDELFDQVAVRTLSRCCQVLSRCCWTVLPRYASAVQGAAGCCRIALMVS